MWLKLNNKVASCYDNLDQFRNIRPDLNASWYIFQPPKMTSRILQTQEIFKALKRQK